MTAILFFRIWATLGAIIVLAFVGTVVFEEQVGTRVHLRMTIALIGYTALSLFGSVMLVVWG